MPTSYATFLKARAYHKWAAILGESLQRRTKADSPPHVRASLAKAKEFARLLAKELRGYAETIAADRLERAIATNSLWLIEQAINFAQLDKVLERVTKPELKTNFMDGATVGVKDLKRLDVTIRFDAIDPQAVQWAEKSSGLLVKHINESQHELIQQAVTRAQAEGRTPGQVARDIKDHIGLLPQHADAVERYRAELTAEGRTAPQVERMTDKYANQLLNYRTDMIARQELLTATHEGQLQTIREAVAQGELDPDRTQRVWNVADDERLCDICRPMDGVGVPADEPWTLEDGSTIWIPQEAHIQCRCSWSLETRH